MLCRLLGLDERERSHRLEINRIGDEDRRLLRELKRVIEPRMPKIVDEFYGHLQKYPEAVAIITGAGATIERLKKTNPRFFAETFKGEFDEGYFESRIVIGKIHAEIGLEPKWFFAAMSTYYDTMFPIILRRYRLNPRRGAKAISAFLKSLNLDQELIMEAYIEFGFIAELRTVVDRSTETSHQLRSSSISLSAAAETSGQAVQSLALTADELSRAASDQANAATRVGAATLAVSESAERLTADAAAQWQSLEEASEAVADIQGAVRAIDAQAAVWTELRNRVEEIERVRTTVQRATEHVREMDKRSDEIGRIVETISEIAAQTNLLALNAAIEAARAGEHGRGFAVVSEEVRKLAENSAAATQEISNLIQAIQASSHLASESMAATLKDVAGATELTEQAAAVLEKIAEIASRANAFNDRLTLSMSELRAKAEDTKRQLARVEEELKAVAPSVEMIAATTEQNSAAVDQLSNDAQAISAQVEELVAGVQSIDEQIAELNLTIAGARDAIARARSAGAPARDRAA